MLFIFGIIFSSESMFITFLLFLYSFPGVIVGFPLVDSQFPSMRLTIFLVGNASVNSSGAHPPPPPANPWHYHFFFKMANSRGWGQVSPSNAPGWDQNRRQMPHPRDHLKSNTAQDFNNKS